MTRQRRIAHYEAQLRRVNGACAALDKALARFRAVRSAAEELDAYYGGDLWRCDLAADEAGLLPEGLRRGVLSEDGAYNALEEYRHRQALLNAMEERE
ncbi:MAG: DUF4298 domain-containing protein [Oscillospiraceae bacterium]|nr:DUF4298 domain-containing protein [Oscillospiraceae bacterium]